MHLVLTEDKQLVCLIFAKDKQLVHLLLAKAKQLVQLVTVKAEQLGMGPRRLIVSSMIVIKVHGVRPRQSALFLPAAADFA